MDTVAKMKRQERRKEIRRPVEPEASKPRAFVAPPCSGCVRVRPDYTNFSRIYGTVRRGNEVVRYVRCHFCGNTWTVTLLAEEPTVSSNRAETIEKTGAKEKPTDDV